MKTLTYQITIKGTKEAVWEELTDADAFKRWTKPFSPNSSFEGTWKEGEAIRFIDQDKGGTVARIDRFEPHDTIVATHIATLNADMQEVTVGEFNEKWIGTKETYRLSEADGATKLFVEMQTHPEFESMFADSWPEALRLLKGMVENP